MIGANQGTLGRLRVRVDVAPQVTAISVLVCGDTLALVVAMLLDRMLFGPPVGVTNLVLLVGALSFGMGLTALGMYPGRGIWGPVRIRMRALVVMISFFSPALAGLLLHPQSGGSTALQCLVVGVIMFWVSSFFELVAIWIAGHYSLWRSDAYFSGSDDVVRRVRRDLSIYPELGLRLIVQDQNVTTSLEDAAVKSPGTPRVNVFELNSRSHLPLYYSTNQAPVFQHVGSMTPAAVAVKRIIDVLGAASILLFLIPLLIGVVIYIYIADGRPIFFFQNRDGLNGKTIRVFKFRSMYRDAQARLEVLLATDPSARSEWEKHFKLRNDPRVLPHIGRLIRVTSIDEIPQLWNVVRGDMSLVGPRPFPDEHLRAFSPEFRAMRSRVMPGLSGLWQVTTRSDGDLNDQECLDRAYIEGWSLWLDIYIMLRTPIALLSGRGAR